MLTAMSATTFVRPDGKEKVTGSGRYTADLNLTGQLHAKLRYADHTHARIVRIETTRARALPRVVAAPPHRPHRHGAGSRPSRRARRPHARGRPGRALRNHGQRPPAVCEGTRAI